jgi:ATP-dependent exoDNAse (exonuclease V) beta subunit
MSSVVTQAPPDINARNTALDPKGSILVQAPAGSGKTDLLTRRFLRLLGEVDDPGQIVAITFTKAAAAEMRQRIMSELEKAEATDASQLPSDPFSLERLAYRALERSRRMDWQLLDLSSRLRISTIDSFCRELALQQPLLSGISGNLEIQEQPEELYRRAARLTLEGLGNPDNPSLDAAVEALLLWRDNNWHEMESLLVEMLRQRDRWMRDFVLVSEHSWDKLRARLERPFANAVADALSHLGELLNRIPGACDEALELARFALCHGGGDSLKDLAEIAELPCGPFVPGEALEAAREAFACLAQFLLTKDGRFLLKIDKTKGFPPNGVTEKLRMRELLDRFGAIPGLAAALDGVRRLPHCRYTEDEWQIVRACFTALRHAAGQLKTVIAEAGTVDFIEVAQIAQQVLQGEDGYPTDDALVIADNIRHLLVDEFQDTSRRQHQLLSSLIAAWPDQIGRSVFVVGDPMQSIYFFRDAEVELFQRIRTSGLEAGDNQPLHFTPADLTANFRTAPELVNELNGFFKRISAISDGSGIAFTQSEGARPEDPASNPRLQLHLNFVPQTAGGVSRTKSAVEVRRETAAQCEAARAAQISEIVALIRTHSDRMHEASASGGKYRVAVLGRARSALASIAEALREANIPFRAVDLETLKERPEILDALALARALMNQQDRVSWLGVLRAPWCGLSLEELHTIAGTDEWSFPHPPVSQLLKDRQHLLSDASRKAVDGLLSAINSVPRLRSILPTGTLGTLLRQVWLALGGEACADATARANLDLFWKLLDGLPEGEQDLCGTALDAALERLCAQPDPATSSDSGVQLMTIHKSKGLEFEVVIVPDLQARTRGGSKMLLSWLERGLANSGESDYITEFLVAPMQPKGAERGRAKEWVDRVYFERESQEMRRILYVAATRAREELHLFARPAYKREKNDSWSIVEPSNSLLAIAWPAISEGVKARFGDWKATLSPQIEDPIVPALAASGDTNVAVMPRRALPTLIRRLPADFQLGVSIIPPVALSPGLIGNSSKPYRRHEGGLHSRTLGSGVHRLLEELAHLRATLDWDSAIAALHTLEPAIVAQIRATGFPASEASSIATQAIKLALNAANDAVGQWILSPHTDAASEAGWVGIVDGDLRQVRVDRVFRAGPVPIADGDDTWWVIDFKTAHADDVDPASVLPVFRAAFAPQLEMYSALLRNLHGANANLRAGLYYPRMSVLDWWEA